MEKVFLKLCVMVLVFIGSVQFVYADEGKKAIESEVNARFEALEAALGGGSGIKVYNADNEYLGDLVNMGLARAARKSFPGSPITIYSPTMDKFINLTGDGVVSVFGTNANPGYLFYESGDCSGQPYISYKGWWPNREYWALTSYFVHAHKEGSAYNAMKYYVTDSFEPQRIFVGSKEDFFGDELVCYEQETPREEDVLLAVSVELPFVVVKGELQFK